ncbi:hypothetical protein P0F65_00595 [Sphingomonas sp. I4]
MMWAIGAAALLTMTGHVATAPQDQRSEQQRLSDAAVYGVMIYAFDKAAWVSTDSLLEVMPRDQLGGLGGYVIEPIDRETLRATYYRGNAASARAFFVADVRGGKVVRHEILPQPVPLTPTQMILARARDIARDEAAAKVIAPAPPRRSTRSSCLRSMTDRSPSICCQHR